MSRRRPGEQPAPRHFYVRDGGYPEDGHPLRPDEARRCVDALRVGDWVELIGNVGPERDTVERQEIILTEPVKLKMRAPAEFDDEYTDDTEVGQGDSQAREGQERDGVPVEVAP